MKSLLVKGGKTDFQVRQWGIRRTWKSVVPLNRQAGKRGIAVGSSLTHRDTIAWYALARESMGETPMPLSNTPSHNPLKQRTVTGSGWDTAICRSSYNLQVNSVPLFVGQAARVILFAVDYFHSFDDKLSKLLHQSTLKSIRIPNHNHCPFGLHTVK